MHRSEQTSHHFHCKTDIKTVCADSTHLTTVCHNFKTAWQRCRWQNRCCADKLYFCNFRYFYSAAADVCVGSRLSALSDSLTLSWTQLVPNRFCPKLIGTRMMHSLLHISNDLWHNMQHNKCIWMYRIHWHWKVFISLYLTRIWGQAHP